MKSEDYINTRLRPQMEYYDSKSIEFKKHYIGITNAIAVMSGLSTLLVYLSVRIPKYSLVLSVFSMLFTVATPILIVFEKTKNSQNNYKEYRSTYQRISMEIILFQTKSGEYCNKNETTAFNFLVQRCESIMATETQNWVELKEKK